MLSFRCLSPVLHVWVCFSEQVIHEEHIAELFYVLTETGLSRAHTCWLPTPMLPHTHTHFINLATKEAEIIQSINYQEED